MCLICVVSFFCSLWTNCEFVSYHEPFQLFFSFSSLSAAMYTITKILSFFSRLTETEKSKLNQTCEGYWPSINSVPTNTSITRLVATSFIISGWATIVHWVFRNIASTFIYSSTFPSFFDLRLFLLTCDLVHHWHFCYTMPSWKNTWQTITPETLWPGLFKYCVGFSTS